MLSRRLLRIKVLQALYAYFQSKESTSLSKQEKQMLDSINNIYRLFIYQISFIVELFDFAERRLEENKKKLLPTEDDLKPNKRFINNKLYKKLKNNIDLHRKTEAYKINWSEETEIIRKLYNNLRNDSHYKEYMSVDSNSFQDDKEIVLYIIKHHLAEFEVLQSFYEEKSIYWVDDYYIVTQLLIKFIKSYQNSDDENYKIQGIYKTNIVDGENEDKRYIIDLLRKTILRSDEFEEIITQKATNWEFERIALMDVLLLKMAICEITQFETIPLKVTLNEYIEISKAYSSPKSKVFINGILDKLVEELRKDEKINKTGRGLME
jgi:N utilization substance protein B